MSALTALRLIQFIAYSAIQEEEAGASAPTNTVLPAISGTATEGETLSATTGSWDDGGAEISGYAYQWNADGVSISGATSSTYDLTAEEVGAVITVTVTATNAAGSTSATSAGTDEVAEADAPVAHSVTHTANSSVTNPSWADVPFGEDVEDREIYLSLVTTSTGASSLPSAVSIGGVAATLVHSQTYVSFWHAKPAGASGTVAITSGNNRFSIAVHRLTGLLSTTPEDTGNQSSGTANVAVEAPVDSLAGGVVLATFGKRSSGASTLSGVDEDLNEGFGTVLRAVHGSLETASAQTVTPSNTEANTITRAVAAIALR